MINGKAICLPKPKYPATAHAIGVSGEVQVQVLIDENGNVVEAKALTGHPFLKMASEKAAKAARFEPISIGGNPVKVTGIIVYKFSMEAKEVLPDVLSSKIESLGNLNSYALYLPMPKRKFKTYKISKTGSVSVQVKVNLQTRKVIEATAIYGHPLFKKTAEEAALLAKFDFKDRLFCSKYGLGILNYKVKDFIGNAKPLKTKKSAN